MYRPDSKSGFSDFFLSCLRWVSFVSKTLTFLPENHEKSLSPHNFSPNLYIHHFFGPKYANQADKPAGKVVRLDKVTIFPMPSQPFLQIILILYN